MTPRPLAAVAVAIAACAALMVPNVAAAGGGKGYRYGYAYGARPYYPYYKPWPRYPGFAYYGPRYYGPGYYGGGVSVGIVAPPVGFFVSTLPAYYSTVWVGGAPYYYANNAYYMRQGPGYVVVAPPAGQAVEQQQASADELYSYPTRGQSEQQQANDRYACHEWATGQTGFDPTRPLGGVPETESAQKRADYRRAMTACLEGRGYSVR